MNHQPYRRKVPGSSTAVLLIHGIVGTPDHFDDLIPLIPEEWSVSNLLLEGHGQGVAEFAAASMEKWKNQVNRELDHLLATHRRVLTVAHSMGTLFAIQCAIDHPDRVKGLFLLAVPLRPWLRPEAVMASVKISLGIAAGDRTAEAMGNDSSVALEPGPWKYLPWAPRFWELLAEARRIRTLLPQLAVPTVALQSCRDELVSGHACQDLRGNHCIRVIPMKHSGHFGYEGEDRERLLRYFQEFVREESA